MKPIDFPLYLITDRTQTAGRPLLDVLRAALAGGVRAVQLRDKDLPDGEYVELARALRVLTREFGALLFINRRVDVALAVGADGVHLGAASAPVAEVRRRCGRAMLIGYSSHGLAEARQAVRDGADFITFGPVFATPSKAAYGEPLGCEVLQRAVEALPVPVFALGGVKPENLPAVRKAGCSHIALISAVSAAPDPCRATRELLANLGNPLPTAVHHELRINSYGHYLRRRFDCRISKVNVDAGFTCPNRDGSKGTGGCIYCNNVSFSPKDTQPVIPLEEQLSAGMAYHRHRLGSEKFIVYFQKYTNTYASADVLADLYRRALAHPDVIGISVGTRPDSLTDGALELLTEIARDHYVCLELGLQSRDDAILARINRGHTVDDFCTAVKRAAGRNFDICAHLIHGFPGERREDFLKSADLIASLPIDSVKLHQLHAVEGTELAAMYRRGEFVPLTLEKYVAAAADFLERLPAHVTIQRLYGSAPLAICVAPRWGLKNNQMWFAVVNELRRRGTWQGYRVG
ncbi:TIGR01212 family radical SAM protein [Oryzomonas rubra]|uniref:Thiamine-phosphate synthase n=1 Tax=Oryzomonas rubra TaxID=2509454 RepID=A0A5A9XFG0_9BACT|nr:TIGR01212 family radical SAM protein [Oryzomonas rubra]